MAKPNQSKYNSPAYLSLIRGGEWGRQHEADEPFTDCDAWGEQSHFGSANEYVAGDSKLELLEEVLGVTHRARQLLHAPVCPVPPVRLKSTSDPFLQGLLDDAPTKGGLKDDALRRISGDLDIVKAQLAFMGIPFEEVGRDFPCVLPGHEGPACLHLNAGGTYVYMHSCDDKSPPYLLMPEVRYALATGKITGLPAFPCAVWQARTLIESGVVSPALVSMRPLPGDVRPALQKTYDGFLLLLQSRWLHTPGLEAAFAWGFASEWCGVGERHCGAAIQELVALDIIEWKESYQRGKNGKRGRMLRLYLPCPLLAEVEDQYLAEAEKNVA